MPIVIKKALAVVVTAVLLVQEPCRALAQNLRGVSPPPAVSRFQLQTTVPLTPSHALGAALPSQHGVLADASLTALRAAPAIPLLSLPGRYDGPLGLRAAEGSRRAAAKEGADRRLSEIGEAPLLKSSSRIDSMGARGLRSMGDDLSNRMQGRLGASLPVLASPGRTLSGRPAAAVSARPLRGAAAAPSEPRFAKRSSLADQVAYRKLLLSNFCED